MSDGAFQSDGLAMLGVVPVFVNAGAALLPAIVAGMASVVAVLLKPRELWRICRTRPHIPLLVVAGVAGLYFGISWLMAPAAPAEGRKLLSAPGRTDWAQVAIRILEDRERARLLGPSGSTPAVAQVAGPANQGRAMIFRGDPSRTGYGGGPAPVKLAAAWRYGEPDTMYLSSPALGPNRHYFYRMWPHHVRSPDGAGRPNGHYFYRLSAPPRPIPAARIMVP